MSEQSAKQALWQKICKEHAALARGLQACKNDPEPHVSIEGYPRRTVEWIRQAIDRHAPATGEHIRTVLEPAKQEMTMFKPRITVAVDELIAALMSSLKETESMRKVG